MLDRLNEDFRFFQQSLGLRAQRQEVLSSNIANADTPGYKARDVDFASSLAGALKRTSAPAATSATASSGTAQLAMAQPAGVTSGMTMASTEPGHMTGKASLIPTGGQSQEYGKLAYRVPTQPSLDGNTVDLDAERVQFADNTLHYESGMTEMTQQMKQLLASITSGG